jgi:hypothetical protein
VFTPRSTLSQSPQDLHIVDKTGSRTLNTDRSIGTDHFGGLGQIRKSRCGSRVTEVRLLTCGQRPSTLKCGELRAVRTGFVYVPAEASHPLVGAVPGIVVANADRKPPWIVVDHDPLTIIVTGWPGKLWYVEVMDAISAEESRAAGSGLVQNPGYTRAAAVRVVKQVASHKLLGPTGAPIEKVLNAARFLELAQAEALAAARGLEAARAYSRVWRRWYKLIGADPGGGNFAGVLRVGLQGASPIGLAPTIIEHLVSKRAQEICGPGVWRPRLDDPDESDLSEPWPTAADALRDAACAVGRGDCVTPEDRNFLLAAWREAFGVVGLE